MIYVIYIYVCVMERDTTRGGTASQKQNQTEHRGKRKNLSIVIRHCTALQGPGITIAL